MEQYISKSSLVAEIEKCYNECLKRAKIIDSDYWNAKADAYRNVLAILDDTIEVKEVDMEHLEQEVQDFCERFDDRKESWYNMTPHDQELMVLPTFANFAMQIAKHFFELGMQISNKAQKGEGNEQD